MTDPSRFRSYVRIGMHEYFLEIALAGFDSYKKLFAIIQKSKAEGGFIDGEPPEEKYYYNEQDIINQAELEITLHIIKSVVFLCMYCEAYIWDLGASILGDGYAKKYLDKLDTVSKWVVIPGLLFGKNIDPGHHGMEKLRGLIKWLDILEHVDPPIMFTNFG